MLNKLNKLYIPQKNQATINEGIKDNTTIIGTHNMFSIFITHEEKSRYSLDLLNMHDTLELWLYKNLELNKKEYLNILARRIGINNKLPKYELVDILSKWIVFN